MSQSQIPFLDLITPHRELEDELVEVFREAVRSAQFIGGPQVEAFEREFAEYCGTKYCVGVGSGTDAVRFALLAAGVGPGDAVITVANTFIATVEGISQAGAATEFVDVDERTYNLSPEALAAYLADCRTDAATGRPLGMRSARPIRAIVPVHLYGQMADMTAIAEIADRYGLILVEDACQAHGATHNGLRAGSIGKAGAFSFYPGKNLGACGEAGAITTNDENVAATIRMIRDHGQSRKYYHQLEGYNGRLDAIQAAFLRIKLRHLDSWTEARRGVAYRYNTLLASLVDVGLVRIPLEAPSGKSVYHLYVIQVADRERLVQVLSTQGIQTALHYPVPLHLQKCYRRWGYNAGSLPVTESSASHILSLPMFPDLTIADQQRIATSIQAALDVARQDTLSAQS